jgi:ABC-type multidrug transport system fused ATPase/permease subunit
MVKDADHVIILSNGEITGQGSPAELITKNEWFASFAKANNEA